MELNKLIKIRQYLHQHPEVSHKEKQTSAYLIDKIAETRPDEVTKQKDGYGFLVQYKHKNPEPLIAFRTDIDALPIQEINTFDYKSQHNGVAHKCGHDGHATSMLGFAHRIKDSRTSPINLVFQGAEETGTGAEQWLN
jgi:amidohydrolase